MYRTDKQFMKNPATAPSRVYVGGLPKAIIADDLEAKFSKHGKILGLVINSGFAFIQYDNENEAQTAIRAENKSMMMGKRIIVRQAFAGKDSGGPPNKAPTPQKIDTPMKGPLSRDNEPPMNVDRGAESRHLSFEHSREEEMDMPEEEMDTGLNIRPPPQKFEEDRGRRNMRGGGGGGMNKGGGRGGGAMRNKSRDRFDAPPPRDFRDVPPIHREQFPDRGGPGSYDYGPPHGAQPEIIHPPDRNDCEIIVVSRALTEYAEFIESRLKHLGLIVDLLFPNEDVPIGKVLANISSRGCLFAILVMPQNEEHRSLTLNILHGIPQEHRNMPIDDALILIQRNFEAYMRGEKPPEDPVKMSLADRHPAPIQMLFNLLAENRMLNTSQYDRLIKYLQERKDLQQEHEVSEGVSQDSSRDAPQNKQSELQNRILNILNKSNDPPIPTSITAPEPVSQEAPTPLLKDPSVQKALDSILSGDMFKGMVG